MHGIDLSSLHLEVIGLLHREGFFSSIEQNTTLAMGIFQGTEPLMCVDHPVDVLSLFLSNSSFFPNVVY